MLCLHSTVVPVCLQGGRQLIGHKTWPSTHVTDIAGLLSNDGCPHRRLVQEQIRKPPEGGGAGA